MARQLKLTPEEKDYIREQARLGTLTYKAMADKFNVSTSSIQKIATSSDNSETPITIQRNGKLSALEVLEREVEQHKQELNRLESVKLQIEQLQQIIGKKERALETLKGE